MEKEAEEEKNPKRHMSISTAPDWLDLPVPIATNIILEHLDIVDYIRFSAVCKEWLSVQKEHRMLYAPRPPPSSIPFPWLRCIYNPMDDLNSHFYVPDKQKLHNITIAPSANRVYKSDYGFGWLRIQRELSGLYKSLCLLNPITGIEIELSLPKLDIYTSLMSSPPTNPDCTILIIGYDHRVYFYRLNDNSGLIKTNHYIKTMTATHFIFHNKLYYMKGFKKIHIVDVLLNPVEQIIKMDCSEICVDMNRATLKFVDFLGEIVAVIMVYARSSFSFFMTGYENVKEIFIYRADFTTSKWVRMETLGDHVLFYGDYAVFSLPAVAVGCKKNNIYLARGFKGNEVAWSAFDISTKLWTYGPLMSVSNGMCHSSGKCWSWFLPTLDYCNVAKANEVRRIQFK